MNHNETTTTIQYPYACAYRPSLEGGYIVRCAAFPGLITEGDTLEDARRNAREALELCVDSYLARDWPLPPSVDNSRQNFVEILPVKLALA